MIYDQSLRLRAIEPGDLSRFVVWVNDPEISHNLLISLPLSTQEEESWYANMLARPAEEHTLAIEVQQGQGWMHIGSTGLHNVDWRVRSAEFGIFIGEKCMWNQGLGTQVTRLMARHAFGTLNLNRLYLHVFATNARAIRAYEKAGFIHEGCLRQAMYKHGQYIDLLVMSMLRSEWEGRTANAAE